MTEQTPPKARFSAATVALAAAALLVIGALVYRFAFAAPSGGGGETAVANNMAAAQPGNLEDSIAGLRERLRQDPDNHEGWFLLGLAYREGGRFDEAEQAFRRAMELAPRNADYVAYLGETLLLRAGNTPPPEAEQLFRQALEIQPDNPQAKYYLATIKDVRGDHRGAVDDLIALLRAAPPEAPWEPQVRQAVEGIARENNIDIANRLPPARTPAPSPATAAIPGPTQQQLDQARSIPPSQQDEMVRGMVDRLAQRLRQNPRDEAGWNRLMRSRMVMNDRPGATQALRDGLAAFANDTAVQGRLRAAAEELGVPAP